MILAVARAMTRVLWLATLLPTTLHQVLILMLLLPISEMLLDQRLVHLLHSMEEGQTTSALPPALTRSENVTPSVNL